MAKVQGEKKADNKVVEAVPEAPPLGYVTGTNMPRTRHKVSIVGFAPSCEMVRQVWDDPDMEVWAINQLYMAMPMMVEKATRWFQIHHRHTYDANVNRDHSHHEWMSQQTAFPIYMQRREPDIPYSVEFPKDALLEKFFRRYFTNSISWQVALAIYEGFDEIHLYGVDMAQDSEYAYERPSVEYFLGWAEGAGIKLIIPESSDILKTVWLYPYDDTAPFKAKLTARRAELRARINANAQQEQAAHDARLQLLGAIDNCNYLERTWSNAASQLEQPRTT